MKIGAILESFRLSDDDAIDAAARLGIEGIQMYATGGAHAPENLSRSDRTALLAKLRSRGLVFSALCGDLGHGFGDAARNPELIARSRRILELSVDLDCRIVTTHIGVVPENPAHPRYKIMQEACGELAAYADRLGAKFAVETGPETADTLRRFLDSLNSRGVSVNLDPANLIMVTGDNPVRAVETLRPYIIHTHAKDGVKLRPSNPEYVYRAVHPVPTEFEGVEYFREVPLGQGGVVWDAYLAALRKIGYDGYLTIEREVGERPAADIETAVKFLKSHIKKEKN